VVPAADLTRVAAAVPRPNARPVQGGSGAQGAPDDHEEERERLAREPERPGGQGLDGDVRQAEEGAAGGAERHAAVGEDAARSRAEREHQPDERGERLEAGQGLGTEAAVRAGQPGHGDDEQREAGGAGDEAEPLAAGNATAEQALREAGQHRDPAGDQRLDDRDRCASAAMCRTPATTATARPRANHRERSSSPLLCSGRRTSKAGTALAPRCLNSAPALVVSAHALASDNPTTICGAIDWMGIHRR
jgi:hypothetical protein